MELGSQQYVKGPGIIIPLKKVLLNSGFPVCKPPVFVSPSNPKVMSPFMGDSPLCARLANQNSISQVRESETFGENMPGSPGLMTSFNQRKTSVRTENPMKSQ